MDTITLTVRGTQRIIIEIEPDEPIRIEIESLTSSTDGAPIVPFRPRRGGSSSGSGNMPPLEPHPVDPC